MTEAVERHEPIEDYHQDRDYDSKTCVSSFLDRPSSYWKKYLAPPEFREPFKKSKSLRMGGACHVKTQEPELWNELYLVAPYKTRSAAAFRAIVAENPDKTVLTLTEYDEICRMAQALWDNPETRHYLEIAGDVEKSFYYTDPVTGTKLKARPDKTSHDSVYLIDIKTTQNIAAHSFLNDTDKYKYWLSPPISFRGIEAVRATRPKAYVYLLVENRGEKRPDTDVFFADEESIEYGQLKLNETLFGLKKCKETDYWPCSHNPKPKPVGLKSYRKQELERLRMESDYAG